MTMETTLVLFTAIIPGLAGGVDKHVLNAPMNKLCLPTLVQSIAKSPRNPPREGDLETIRAWGKSA